MRDRQIGRETHPKSREALSDLQAGDSFPGELPLSHWWILKNSQKSTKVVIKQKLCPNSWTYFHSIRPTLKLINNLPFGPLMNMKLFSKSFMSQRDFMTLLSHSVKRKNASIWKSNAKRQKSVADILQNIHSHLCSNTMGNTLHFDSKLCVILNQFKSH